MNKTLKIGALAGLLLGAALPPTLLRADGAAVVVSGDLRSYQEAFSGFQKAFGRPFQQYVLPASDDRQRSVWKAVKAQQPRILVLIGSKAAVDGLGLSHEVPLVYCMVVNPEQQGLLGQKNVYGVDFSIQESVLFSKYKEALPNLKRLGVITEKPQNRAWLERASAEARKSGFELVAEQVASSSKIPEVMRSLSGKIDAFWMTTDPIVANRFAFNTISAFCINSRIPLLVPAESLVDAGGYLAVTASERSMGETAASLAKNILDGNLPDSSLVQASKINVTVSPETAKKIGLGKP